MIAQIKIQTQYGQVGQAGPSQLPEIADEPSVVYAHSVQDALEWVRSKPLYRDAVVDPIGSGYAIYSKWVDYDNMSQIFETDKVWEKAKYFRHFLTIAPVNTIYEAEGYK